MFADQERLHIADPEIGAACGLAAATCCAMRGCASSNGKNSLTARVENFPIDLMFVRDDDIPTFVSDGVCEFGVVGRNVLEEFALERPDARFDVVATLGFGRCALRIAAPERTRYEGPQTLAGQRIATSIPTSFAAIWTRTGSTPR